MQADGGDWRTDRDRLFLLQISSCLFWQCIDLELDDQPPYLGLEVRPESGLTVPSVPPTTKLPSSSRLRSQSPTLPTFIVPMEPSRYPLQLTSPEGVTVTIHLRLVLISLEKVEREDEVVVEEAPAAAGRLYRYHVSVGVGDEVAFLNLEAPNRAAATIVVDRWDGRER